MLYITLLVGTLTSALCWAAWVANNDRWPPTPYYRLVVGLMGPCLFMAAVITCIRYRVPLWASLWNMLGVWWEFIFFGEGGTF